MQAVKTAVSLDKNIFDQAETLAQTLKVSRSKLYSIALQDFFEHQKNRELLAQINAVYDDGSDATEKELQSKLRHQHRRMVEGEW
jgi:metal-responsive CopG/Arc/MetJ family transcriptional regulator